MQDFSRTADGILTSDAPTFQQMMTGKEYAIGEGTADLLGWNSDQAERLTSVPETERSGLMTHPVVLSTYAHETQSNPVARGHFVSRNLLCVTVPNAPADVEFPKDDGIERTLREVLETKHSVAACAGCHALMDPMGFPFEIFDAVGRLRDNDNGFAIDATGGIAGTSEIDGPVENLGEMMGKIGASPRAQTCFAEQALQYVAGLGGDEDLTCRANPLAEKFIGNSGNVPQLFVDLLASNQFLRRTEAPVQQP